MPRRASEPERDDRPPMDCPRCGYDQSGVIASWTNSCPIEGTCSECGFDFLWADVLIRERQHLRWLYEHREGLAVGSMVQTLIFALCPWVFWKRVRPHHRINPKRAFGFCVALFGGAAVLSVVVGVVALAVRRFIYGDAAMIQTTQSFYESYWFVVLSQFLVTESLYVPGSNSSYGGGLLAVLALSVYSISIAFCAAVAQRSRKGSGIRQGHLLRALAYSYVGPWMVYFVFVVLWGADRISLWDIGSTQYEYWYSYSSYSYVAQSQGWVGLRGFAWACYFYWGAYWWVMFLWITLWWLFALKSGFRLRGWWQIWPLGIILGVVATAFVAFFVESMLMY